MYTAYTAWGRNQELYKEQQKQQPLNNITSLSTQAYERQTKSIWFNPRCALLLGVSTRLPVARENRIDVKDSIHYLQKLNSSAVTVRQIIKHSLVNPS